MSNIVLATVDNLLEIPEEEYKANDEDISDVILDSINVLVTLVQGSSGDDFTFSGSNIVLAAVKMQSTGFPLSTGIYASSLSKDDEFSFEPNSAGPERSENLTSVYLPETILDLIPGTYQTINLSLET